MCTWKCVWGVGKCVEGVGRSVGKVLGGGNNVRVVVGAGKCGSGQVRGKG